MEWRAHISDEYRAWARDAVTVQFTRRCHDGAEQIVGFNEYGEPVTTIVGEGMTPQFPGFMIPRDAVHALAEHIKPGPSQGEVKRLEQALAVERERVDKALADASMLPYRPGHDDLKLDAQIDAIHLMLRQQHRDLNARLARIERAINSNTLNDTLNTEAIMANFQPIYDEVEPLSDAIDSVTALVSGLSDQLTDAANDPEEILAIASTLAAEKDRLAALVLANTPAAPEPTPEPEPVEPEPAPEG